MLERQSRRDGQERRSKVSSVRCPTPHTVTKEIEASQQVAGRLLGGSAEPAARLIERAMRPFGLHLSPGLNGLRATGDEPAVTIATELVDSLCAACKAGVRLSDELILHEADTAIDHALRHHLAYHLPGLPHPLRPMSLGQVAFMDGILQSGRDLIFGVGETGTGKTHIAVAAGLHLVTEAHFKSLIITRPRVMMEGEIMTANLRAETDYDEQLTPMEDVLCDLLGHDEMKRRMTHGLIEIVPLGRMRGRTFNGCFVVVDEAQNLTIPKMRMVLTRLGRGSRMVVTGDPAQCDLPDEEVSGLTHILPLISRAGLASVHQFDSHEIVRNNLVAQIEALYLEGGEFARRAAA